MIFLDFIVIAIRHCNTVDNLALASYFKWLLYMVSAVVVAATFVRFFVFLILFFAKAVILFNTNVVYNLQCGRFISC